MKNHVTKKTEKILLRVIKYLEQEKDRIDMHNWGRIFKDNSEQTFTPNATRNTPSQKIPPCRTTACIAGTCLLVTKQGKNLLDSINKSDSEVRTVITFPWDTDELAKYILNITDKQSSRLFFFKEWEVLDEDGVIAGWPSKFENQYKKAKTSQGRFNAVKGRILHFIKTGE